ncbi:cupin domain-containing protein [Pseudoramibacter sp. HA2172]|uniref:cupin domain-containing protein n=1 Tax=Pseudoramibacter faecis TaxID=3108534 RepID=UPI002E78CAF1|nr:cupin domain-containing protein [Pseudoramibacter sp. HA2172]
MKAGKVFSIARDNPAVPGCTVSGEMLPGVLCFSLAAGTDISAERYPNDTLQLQLAGYSRLTAPDGEITLAPGTFAVKPAHTDIGVAAEGHQDSIYLEMDLPKENTMHQSIQAGEIFALADLVPYQDGKIVNMDVVNSDHLKFVVMAFDDGCALAEHAAPGDALVFALEGHAEIGYDGESHAIAAGENFRFAKGGLHSVRATGRFKMALLLMRD